MIAEDNQVVCDGIAQLLRNQPDMKLVKAVACGRTIIRWLEKGVMADVVLTDLNMPEMDGIALTKHLALNFPDVKVVILSMHNKKAFVNKALQAGARGYVMKTGEVPEIFSALRTVYAGNTYVSPMKKLNVLHARYVA